MSFQCCRLSFISFVSSPCVTHPSISWYNFNTSSLIHVRPSFIVLSQSCFPNNVKHNTYGFFFNLLWSFLSATDGSKDFTMRFLTAGSFHGAPRPVFIQRIYSNARSASVWRQHPSMMEDQWLAVGMRWIRGVSFIAFVVVWSSVLGMLKKMSHAVSKA